MGAWSVKRVRIDGWMDGLTSTQMWNKTADMLIISPQMKLRRTSIKLKDRQKPFLKGWNIDYIDYANNYSDLTIFFSVKKKKGTPALHSNIVKMIMNKVFS